MQLGKRILVVGVTAAGKTTFAKKLATILGLPVFFVDSFMWRPGWDYLGEEGTAKMLDEISAKDSWILEGYIVRPARSLVFERADTIIYLDYAPLLTAWRYIKRWLKHRKHPRHELPGSPEKFSFKFLDLAWSKGETKYVREYMAQADAQKVIRLTSPAQAKQFLADV